MYLPAYIRDIHGTVFPPNPFERELFYRDDLHALFYYNGTAWINAGGLGPIGVKVTPIDADKELYLNSTAGDAPVTSTWTQIKAFLKTYFDTVYDAIGSAAAALAALAAHAADADAHHAVHLKTLADHPLAIIPTMDDDHIPAIIARDAEVDAAVAAEAAARVADVDAEEAARIAADNAHAVLKTGVHSFDKSCRVNHSAYQTLPTNTVVFSAFDTEVWDTDEIHDTVTNNSRLTCKTAGKYMIAGGGQFVANATGRRHAQIKLNGTTVIAGQHLQAVTDAGGVTSLSLATIYALAVDDYVELGFYQASGGDLDLQGGQIYSPWFSMARIA